MQKYKKIINMILDFIRLLSERGKNIWKYVKNVKKKFKAKIYSDKYSILSDLTKISHVQLPDNRKLKKKFKGACYEYWTLQYSIYCSKLLL